LSCHLCLIFSSFPLHRWIAYAHQSLICKSRVQVSDECHIDLSTPTVGQELMKSMGSPGSWSLLFMMKLTVQYILWLTLQRLWPHSFLAFYFLSVVRGISTVS
jgi:hypothetical protein